MILLPLVGLLSGLLIGRRAASVVTAALAAISFSLVALLTDETTDVERVRDVREPRGIWVCDR